MRDCTLLFLRYCEIARAVWNSGFWRQWSRPVASHYEEMARAEAACACEEALARLFECIVLLPLGHNERIAEWPGGLGQVVEFMVSLKTSAGDLKVDRNLPDEPGHFWGDPVVRIGTGTCLLRFVSFFDWNQLAPRDFRMVKVLIEEFKDRPDLIGRHALIEIDSCSFWIASHSNGDSDVEVPPSA
jgi:hypothetical protein